LEAVCSNRALKHLELSYLRGSCFERLLNTPTTEVLGSNRALEHYCLESSSFLIGPLHIGYDDTQSISTKVTYAKGKGLLGYFAWHVGADKNFALSQTGSYEYISIIYINSIFMHLKIC
jgi:hypothetical protein